MFDNLFSFQIYSSIHMTKTVPVKNRPRIKKANKRKTRIYWRKQPKFVTVPSTEIVQMGNKLYCHPVMVNKLQKELTNGP